MDRILLWAAPLVLLGLLVGVWLLLRPRRVSPPAPVLLLRPAAVPAPPQPTALPSASSVAAQREAAVEALRQARRRAAAGAARLEAARQARPPVQAPVPAPLAGRIEPALRPPSPPPASLPGSGSPTGPLTVLVVDDSKVVRIKTSRLLEKHGYQVLLADDGLAALACLDARAVDLVITDVEMPGLDGFGLTQRLRSQPRWTRLPVIMITSSDEKHRADAATVGVDVLLGKPYDEPALLAEVQHALGLAARRAGAGMVLQ